MTSLTLFLSPHLPSLSHTLIQPTTLPTRTHRLHRLNSIPQPPHPLLSYPSIQLIQLIPQPTYIVEPPTPTPSSQVQILVPTQIYLSTPSLPPSFPRQRTPQTHLPYLTFPYILYTKTLPPSIPLTLLFLLTHPFIPIRPIQFHSREGWVWGGRLNLS